MIAWLSRHWVLLICIPSAAAMLVGLFSEFRGIDRALNSTTELPADEHLP